jgi:hypothetical protein
MYHPQSLTRAYLVGLIAILLDFLTVLILLSRLNLI